MNEIHPEQLGLKQHHLMPNIIIYENPLTKKLILAGDLGINKELIGDDFPIIYVHKDKWDLIKRLKKEKNELDLSEVIGEEINIRKLVYLNKMKLGSRLEPKPNKVKSIQDRITQEDLRSVDELLDKEAVRKEQVLHQLESKECNYFMDMSGINKQLSEIYADNYDDNYILNEKEFADAAKFIDTEEEETNLVGFTNADCETVKKFIEAEATSHPQLSCDRCQKRECDDCNMLRLSLLHSIPPLLPITTYYELAS